MVVLLQVELMEMMPVQKVQDMCASMLLAWQQFQNKQTSQLRFLRILQQESLRLTWAAIFIR